MTISLIIPVYNVEGFLRRCLESVEKQTYKDAEVIIINDGSTDNSPSIINAFVEQNANFTTYTIENSGLGGARNYGLGKATGDYVLFLDSDDYIAPDCLEKLSAKALEDNSDIVVCNSCDVDEAGAPIRYVKNSITNGTTSLYDDPTILFNRVSAWGKLYRRSLFDGLRYVAREWYEDLRLTPKLFLKAQTISYIEDVLFFYVQRAGSIMNNANTVRNLEIVTALEDLIGYFKEQNMYDRFQHELEYLVIENIAVAAVTRVAISSSADKREVLSQLEAYLRTFPQLYANPYINHLSGNKKLILHFNKRRLYALTRICMKVKKALNR